MGYRIFDRQFLPSVTVVESHAGLRVSAGKVVSAKLELRGTKKLSRLSLLNTRYQSLQFQEKVRKFLKKTQLARPGESGFFFACYPANGTLLRTESTIMVSGVTIAEVVTNASRILRSLRSFGVYAAAAHLEVTKVVDAQSVLAAKDDEMIRKYGKKFLEKLNRS
jgi:hypothetical protein